MSLTYLVFSLSEGFDSDLDGDLEDDGESPPTKTKAKKTPGQSRVTTKDHTVSTFMHAFQESERMARLDAQEERAHQRKQVSFQCHNPIH